MYPQMIQNNVGKNNFPQAYATEKQKGNCYF